MSRERELLRVIKLCRPFVEQRCVHHPYADNSIDDLKLLHDIDAILSQSEAEPPPANSNRFEVGYADGQLPPPADAPTPEKCPACKSPFLVRDIGPVCGHSFHSKEPAPQQHADAPTPETDDLDVKLLTIGWVEAYDAMRERSRKLERQRDEAIGYLRWLRSHCAAIGMTKKSDSGLTHQDVALFTTDLKSERDAARAELARLKEPKRAHSCDDPLCAVCGHPYG